MTDSGNCVNYTTEVPMLVSRQFDDDEVLLANLETGLYYSLAGTAADIWLGLKAGATVDEIVAAFGVFEAEEATEKKQAVESFIERLLSEGIIAPTNSTPDRQQWSPRFSSPFSPPMLDRFDDLRDLLLLDPVHNVGETGWPTRAKDAD